MKKFLVILMVVAMASFLFVGCLPGVTPPDVGDEDEDEAPPVTGAKIDIPAIPGVTAPVAGAVPDLTVTATAQYTGKTTWSPTVVGTFAAGTVYTATITLTPKTGYTLTGVLANFFTVAGAASDTNPAGSGVVTAVYVKTPAVAIIDLIPIAGVIAPVTGAVPDLLADATVQYTGAVTWSPAIAAAGTFAAGTVYTATITLTPKAGYTLNGVLANFFTVATIVTGTDTNPANSGVVTAIFAKTAPAAPTVKWTTTGNRNGVINAGETLILTFSAPMTTINVGIAGGGVGGLDTILVALSPALAARTHGTVYTTDVTAAWNAANTVLTVTYVAVGAAGQTDIAALDTITATGFTSVAGVALTAATATWPLPTVASASSF